MPDPTISDIAISLARLETKLADLERRTEHIETVVARLGELAANAKGGWLAFGAAASAGAAIASLVGPLLKKLGA